MSLVSVKRRTMVAMQDYSGRCVLSAPMADLELSGYLFSIHRDPDWKLLYLVRCRPRGAQPWRWHRWWRP